MKQQQNISVVGLGEILWDMFPEGKQLGGAPANFAYHMANLGFDSYALSSIGKDSLGDEVLETLADKPLKTIFPRVDEATGTVQITLDDTGIPKYEIMQGVAWDNIPFTQQMQDLASRTKCVCFGTLAQRSPVARETIRRFIAEMPQENSLRVCDINLRQHYYNEEVIEKSLALCNILKINDDELEILTPMLGLRSQNKATLCRELLNRYALDILILTCGENGSYVTDAKNFSFMPTPSVEVVDTVGAGDSFTAAFCASLLKKEDISTAHRNAVELSAYVCTQAGAMPPAKTEEVS